MTPKVRKIVAIVLAALMVGSVAYILIVFLAQLLQH